LGASSLFLASQEGDPLSDLSENCFSKLALPQRDLKPRNSGLTVVIDNGCPTTYLQDVLASHGDLVDFVKFGWGTALVTKQIEQKIQLCRDHNVECFFGGTLFEKFADHDAIEAYKQLCDHHGISAVEVSNGTIDLDNSEKAKYIADLKQHFLVLSEVGYKDSDRSQNLPPSKWIDFIEEDLAAGSQYVITESRESGQSGICRASGELRIGLIEEILASGIDINKLIFEAPKKTLQTHFIQRLGSSVNLANIALGDIVPLETLRLGLRSDTFFLTQPKEEAEVIRFPRRRAA